MDQGEKLFTLRFAAMLIAVALVTVMVAFGGFRIWNTVFLDPRAQEFEKTPHIVLSADSTITEEDVLLTEEDLNEWESPYAEYRSSVLYDSLEDNEKLVYHALEYAMEESLPVICVDWRLIAGEEELRDVLRCLALDSPLLEQNLRYSFESFSLDYPLSARSLRPVYASFEGYYIEVHNFSNDLWKKKMKALEEAKSIVAELPVGLNKKDVSVELFRRIACGAEYFDYPQREKSVDPYLYDALLLGRANCDGYTNALALAYRLAGIECVEKTYNGDAEKDEAGHTWLCFCLDGTWYNADATGGAYVPETVTAMAGGLYHGYADILQKYAPVFAERYPSCEKGLAIEVDAHIATTADLSFTQTIIDGFNKNDDLWTLVVVDRMVKRQVQEHAQAAANTMNCDITTQYVELMEGRTAIFLYTAL